MKMMNCDGDVPRELFIFINMMLPIAAINLEFTKQFSSGAFNSFAIGDEAFAQKYLAGSARYLPYQPCQVDLKTPSAYQVSAISHYRLEYDLEVHREQHFPTYPSRLSCLYAFGDFQSCQLANSKYHWPIASVRRFQLRDHAFNRVVRVNMERVSLARHAYAVSMLDDQSIQEICQSYWRGLGDVSMTLPRGMSRETFASGTLWEYLIEGVVQLVE